MVVAQVLCEEGRTRAAVLARATSSTSCAGRALPLRPAAPLDAWRSSRLASTRFEHRLADYIVKAEPEIVAREFHVVELGPTEVGLRYENGVLAEVLAPNTRRLYWKGYIDLRFEVIDIATRLRGRAEVCVPQLDARRRARRGEGRGRRGVFAVQVPEYHVGVLYVDGKVAGCWKRACTTSGSSSATCASSSWTCACRSIEVAGQEILTKDKVPAAREPDRGLPRDRRAGGVRASRRSRWSYLYKELQFGLRAAVGTRTLDELLENKGVIDEVVAEHIARRVAGFGLEVESVGVKDIILPGEMKVILAKVVEAEKAAQANVIRRREETAATRSLLNTARVMEDNPTALRLKELETLEKVTEKIDKISVFGGLDAVLKDLVKIRG